MLAGVRAIQLAPGQVSLGKLVDFARVEPGEQCAELRRTGNERHVRDGHWERQGPVVMGHELSSELDRLLRATTTVLNARISPLIRELSMALERELKARQERLYLNLEVTL